MMFLVVGPKQSGKDLFCDTVHNCFDIPYLGSTGKYLVEQLFKDFTGNNLEEEMEKKFRPIFQKLLTDKDADLLTFELLYDNRESFRTQLWEYGEFIRQELGDDAIVSAQSRDGAELICGIRGLKEMQSVVNWFDAVFWIHRPGGVEKDTTLKFNINDVLDAMENPEHLFIINNLKTYHDFIADTYNVFQQVILPNYRPKGLLTSMTR